MRIKWTSEDRDIPGLNMVKKDDEIELSENLARQLINQEFAEEVKDIEEKKTIKKKNRR